MIFRDKFTMASNAVFIFLIVCLFAMVINYGSSLECYATCIHNQTGCTNGIGLADCPDIAQHCLKNKTENGLEYGCLMNKAVKKCQSPDCKVCDTPNCNDPVE